MMRMLLDLKKAKKMNDGMVGGGEHSMKVGEEMMVLRRRRERIRTKSVVGRRVVLMLVACWLLNVNGVNGYTTNNSRDADEDGRPVRVGVSPFIMNLSPAPESLDKAALLELRRIAQKTAEHYVQLAFPKANGSGDSYCEYLFLRPIRPLYNTNRRSLNEEESVLLFFAGGFASFRIPSDGSRSPPSTPKLDQLVNDALTLNLLPALQRLSTYFGQLDSIAIGGIPTLPIDDDTKTTSQPSTAPSDAPTTAPTLLPSSSPSLEPTTAPSQTPSSYPSAAPSTEPTQTSSPSRLPSTVTVISERGVGTVGDNGQQTLETIDIASQSVDGNSPSSSSATPAVAGIAATAACLLFFLSALFVLRQRQKQKQEQRSAEDPSVINKSHQTLPSSQSGSDSFGSLSSPAAQKSSSSTLLHSNLGFNASCEESLNSIVSMTSSNTASSSSVSEGSLLHSKGAKSPAAATTTPAPAANLISLSSLVDDGCLQLRLEDGGIDGENKLDSLCKIVIPSASSSATFDTQPNDAAALDERLERARQEAATRAQNVAVAASVVAARKKLQEQNQDTNLQEPRSSSDLSMGAYTTDSSMGSMADESSAGWTTSSETTTPSQMYPYLQSSTSTSSAADASSTETDPSFGYGWRYSPSGHMVRSGYGTGISNHKSTETGTASGASDADSCVSAASSGQSSIAYLSDFDDAGVGGGGMYAASSSYYHHRAVTQPATTSVIAQLNASANSNNNSLSTTNNNAEAIRNATYAIRKDMMSTMNSFDDYHGVYHLPNSPTVQQPPSQQPQQHRPQPQQPPPPNAQPKTKQVNTTNQSPPPPPPPPPFYKIPQQRNSVLQPSHFTASSTQATSSTAPPPLPPHLISRTPSSDTYEPDSAWDPNDNETSSDILTGSDSFTANSLIASIDNISSSAPSS